MKKTLIALSMLAAFSTLSGCNNSSEQQAATYLTVLHTNDNHGRFWHNEKGEYGMAARKTLVDSLRANAQQNGHAVLLLSGGDINTGVPESDLQFAEPDFKGMKLIGYDAMAIGNHEFDNPVSVLAKQQAWAEFPFLSANIINKQTGKPEYQAYQVFEKMGLKIAVIGLTTVDTAKIANPEYIGHLEFKDPTEVTKRLLSDIEAQHKPDVTIAVTHMGHYVDGKHQINAPGDVTLARSLPANALDMIIGGHSQEPVCMSEIANQVDEQFAPGKRCRPDQQNGTWIMQAHEWGKYVGKAEFKIEGERVTLVDYELIPVNLLKPDSDAAQQQYATAYIEPDKSLQAFLAPYQEKGSAQISEPIAQLIGFLDGERSSVRFKPTNLPHLIAKAQMQSVGADFGIISGGGVRSSIEAGDISFKDILKVHPFKNRVAYASLQGSELVDYLTQVASFPPDTGAYPQFYNISFDKSVDGTLSNIVIAGKPFDASKTYKFSINSYNASGGDGYPNLTEHPNFVSTDMVDAEVLRNFFIKNSPVNAADY